MDLLPSNIDLSAAEVQLVHEVAREQTLQRVLAPAIEQYDVILIDCQPSLGLLTVNALTASDGVIVPLECEYFALRGVALLKTTIDKVRERLNPKLEIDGVLGTMYDGRTLHGREVCSGWSRRGATTSSTPSSAAPSSSPTRPSPVSRSRRTPPPRPAPTPTASSPRRCWPGASTSEPPAADDLFRADRAAPTRRSPRRTRRRATSRRRRAQPAATDPARRRRPARKPSGRVRHDEKMTVYVTSDELLDLEHARLTLRRAPRPRRSTAAGSCARRSRWCSPTSRPTATRAPSCGGCARNDARPSTDADGPAGCSTTALGAGQAGAFEVHLDNFEGPFDLLLSLISKHKLDITEVALSRVTDEFIAHVKALGKRAGISSRRRRSWSSPRRCSTSRRPGCCRRATSRTRRTSRCSRRATCSSRGCCSTRPSSRSPASSSDRLAAESRAATRAPSGSRSGSPALLPEVLIGIGLDAVRGAGGAGAGAQAGARGVPRTTSTRPR